MPLAALRYLSNVDKHELVHAAYAVPRTSAIADVKDSIFHRPPVIENGTEIAAYLPDEGAATEMKAVIVIGVAFGRDGRYREVDWGSLHMIGAWVARIVEEFRSATPEFRPSPYPRPTTFMTPDELEEFRRSFVGYRARSEGRPYHEFSQEGERIFHLRASCRVGRAIPVDRLRAGMGRPRLCSRCGRLPKGQAIARAFVAGQRSREPAAGS